MATKHGLGRGLSALIKEVPDAAAPAESAPVPDGAAAGPALAVPLDRIRPNPHQPRRRFEDAALADLVQSIKTHGVLQPLILRQVGNDLQLVAGERRWRAARLAGLAAVPAIVRDLNDRDALEWTLIENLQREDLNPIEEAEGYQGLVSGFALSQEEIAARVGKARATVANALRLLGLPAEIQHLLREGRLDAGHAKALLPAPLEEDRVRLARQAVAEAWSVRVLEQAVARLGRPPRKRRAAHDDIPPAHAQELSDRLHRHFGTRVRLQPSRTLANGKKARGRIEIEFYSNDDLTRILDLCGLADPA